MGGLAARWRRIRRVGPLLILNKLRIRSWSTRVALILASDTDARPAEPPRIPLTYSITPSETVDPGELEGEAARGADALYVEGLVRMYRHGLGDAVVARTLEGQLVAVGLMSDPAHHDALEAAAPGLYPRPAADSCWTEAHYVMPAFRSQRVMSGVLGEERDHLRRRGLRTMVAIVDRANTASLRAFARAGYRPTGVVRLDQYRFNRYSSRFTTIDESTRARWERASAGMGVLG